MTCRTKCQRGSVLYVILFVLSFNGAAAAQITVGPNVQVSKANGKRAHFEVLVAADPENPNHLLGCSIIEADQPSAQQWHTIVYSSIDGGASWNPTFEMSRGAYGSSDPACTFGINNQAYFAALFMGKGFPSSDEGSRIAVYRSLDGGRTWQPPLDLPFIDREYIAVDTTNSKYRGNVYVNGNGSVRAISEVRTVMGSTFFRSLDGGQSFSYPYLVASLPSHHPPGQTQISVLSDGTIVAAFTDISWSDDVELTNRGKTNANIQIVTSSDGEDTFSRPVVAQEVHLCGSMAPSLAVDRSDGSFQNHLYLTWTDLRLGHCDILLIKSSDKGKTWSHPVVVNDNLSREPKEEHPDPFHAMSMVDVNKDGVVGVMWYDPRDSNDKFGYSVRFSASLDGGETFLPSVRVSDVPASYEIKNWQFWTQAESGRDHSDPDATEEVLKGSLGVNLWPGHTTGMAASADGVFHPFWVDNRTGLTQVWTAAVEVHGRAFPHGSVDLTNWEDLTSKLTLQFAHPRFDAGKHIATVEAYLLNTSKDPLSGPFKLRFLSMQSQMGEVKLVESSSSLKGVGAIVDIYKEIPNGKLDPGARTDAIVLQFAVSQPRLDTIKPEIVEFEARVLGKPRESGSKSNSR